MTSPARPSVAVVVLAAGAGSRFQAEINKTYLPLDGIPIVVWSLRRAAALDNLAALLLVIAEADRPMAESVLREHGLDAAVELIVGGASRHASEWEGLRALAPRIANDEIDVVVIHDGARPHADAGLYEAVIERAAEHGGAIPGRAQPAVVALNPEQDLSGELVTVQTPQAFRAGDLYAAYLRADADGFDGTDTASTIERYTELAVVVVPGPDANTKITYPSDVSAGETRRT